MQRHGRRQLPIHNMGVAGLGDEPSLARLINRIETAVATSEVVPTVEIEAQIALSIIKGGPTIWASNWLAAREVYSDIARRINRIFVQLACDRESSGKASGTH